MTSFLGILVGSSSPQDDKKEKAFGLLSQGKECAMTFSFCHPEHSEGSLFKDGIATLRSQ